MSDADDYIKKAGSFFSKLGSQVKSTAKHVTGVGRGDIKLEVDVPKAPPGGTLRGRVALHSQHAALQWPRMFLKPLVAGSVFSCKHHRFPHCWVLAEHRFNLAQFNPETTNLHLVVNPT